MRFDDKVVLVTGGSRGIGRAICQQFAGRGAQVIVHYHQNQSAAEETLAALPGGPHLLVQAAMEDPTAVQQMINTAVAQYGRLDILINNAGIYEEHPLAEVSYEEWQTRWRHILEANLMGPANAMYCAGQQMIRQGYGRIVNISSRGAFRGEPTAPAYGASKAGLNAMGQSLARYLAPYNVFVATVAPGWVATDMAQAHLDSPAGAEIRGQSPLNRVATPDEVAYTAVFLASEGAEFLTGGIVDVNGASYLRT